MLVVSSLLAAALAPVAVAAPAPPLEVIHRVEAMVGDRSVRAMASRVGLDVVNVTWEDTGRTKGSVWGPNISDMTIGVRDASGALHPMPVIRFDNFTDTTADVDIDKLFVRVGNEHGRSLLGAPLEQVLRHPRDFLHDPSSWTGGATSLWADRDAHVLVSAQACFLPVPKEGAATFTPVIYNYQSMPGHPAVLTIVATREGTSIQVLENEGGYLSQPLFFNQDGQRAPFTATRLSDFRATEAGAQLRGRSPEAERGLDMVLVVQVPLKHDAPRRLAAELKALGYVDAEAPVAAAAATRSVETAVIGHGAAEGPFTEIHGLPIERDPRFPVRVTVQFYRATSTGEPTQADLDAIRADIDRVYQDADAIGSLVTSGFTGRPTEWVRPPTATATWAPGTTFWAH